MNVLVGISWPFVNGDLHIGHAASSLSGDVIARFHRLKGNKVVLVSGSDCHGTPIDIKALKENRSAKEIVDTYHAEILRAFNRLNFSYDLYNRTDDPYHKKIVQENFIKYYNKGLIYEKEEDGIYCDTCKLFLADRYIIGICPKCGSNIKEDICEKCGNLLNIEDVKDKKCAICNNKVVTKKTKNLYFKFSAFQKELEKLVESKKNDWRENAYLFSKRYLEEGIPDRCCIRSLKWGIDVPIPGYEDKKIYVWTENVIGYITACKKYCEKTNQNYEEYWKNGYNNKTYFVHAKDNIPFHTIILPSLLLGLDENYKLPDKIVSDEYITIEGEKLSKSKGNYISVNDILDRYKADTVRYYLLSNDPNTKDFNFTWNDFINTHNSELLGKWGNIVNGVIDNDIKTKLIDLYNETDRLIDDGEVKTALHKIFDFINYTNKYFDENKPWELANSNPTACENILYNVLNIIYNINTLLNPFIPETSNKVFNYLNKNNSNWKYDEYIGKISNSIEPLFERYDKTRIENEISNFKNNK